MEKNVRILLNLFDFGLAQKLKLLILSNMSYPPLNHKCAVTEFKCLLKYNLHVFSIDSPVSMNFGIKPLRELVNPGKLVDHPSRKGIFTPVNGLEWSYIGGTNDTGEFHCCGSIYKDRIVKINDFAAKILEKSLSKDIQWEELHKLLGEERMKELKKRVKEQEMLGPQIS